MKTDVQLKSDVVSGLDWEPSINSAEIGVEVKSGVVTLAGLLGTNHVYHQSWTAT
jgi:osmotically-inducible protein OsmY